MGLLRYFCGNLDEKFVSISIIEWFERDVPAMDEVGFRRNFRLSCAALVQQVIFPPLQRESLGREGLGYN